MNKTLRTRFWILVSLVAISGFSQGMLLPLIAIIFEKDGVSSTLNGLNAAGLYIGILLASPFMEPLLRKHGYKPIIMWGGALVILSLFLFPLWKSVTFWFLLRLAIGIGDHALHFATQTWITAFSPVDKRGRNISLYGLSFGIGFAVGPLMANLVNVSETLPFIFSAFICLVTWVFLFLLKNEIPTGDEEVSTMSFTATMKRFSKAIKYGWIAFLPPLGYGFLESSLNGIFPIYGLRIGLNVEFISLLLTSFAVGGIIFQLPLGMLSDKHGRKFVLHWVLFLGSGAFLLATLLEATTIPLLACLFIGGMLLGSTFSLGISYMTDLMPSSLLPTGNLLCGIAFSVGSLAGPYLGGTFIGLFEGLSFFVIISSVLFLIFLCIILFSTSVQTYKETTLSK
ncbi:MFS transporter [Priestia flexa]|uniref:MFS transporter n=1 Tax=Priestia flexa TaxID=86664 RepID=UPI00240DFEDF|nr:MFS transporter [Priestia flexa]MED3824879.1 MFS transporter [Priestia flexa]WEZ08494.1 MFS transporter [Priestia flexa]